MTPRRLLTCATIGLLLAGLVSIVACSSVGTARSDGVTGFAPRESARSTGDLRMLSLGPAESERARSQGTPSWVTAGPLPPNEEVWIISQPDWESEPEFVEFNNERFQVEDLGSGVLLAAPVGSETFVPAPLQHTDVQADIAGFIASVGVTQTYANPFDVKIEATYVFPLPQNSAVSEFVMTIGERRIRGIVREREQAEQLYDEARAAGMVASLMTQERPNIFTQKVANIEPGREIDIDVTYFHTVPKRDGWYEFVFPMTVGPRYNPSGTRNGVGATPRGWQGASGQPTEVTYLAPGERTGHDVSIAVHLDAGAPLDRVYAPGHEIETDLSYAQGSATVRLRDADAIPNRDFVLRYRLDESQTRPTLMTHRDGNEGFFALTLHPPTLDRLREEAGTMPVEMIFVVDTSGSMSGRPLQQAKDAIETTLRQLGPSDAFQIIRFANDASPLGTRVVTATDRNKRDALERLRSLRAQGGTEMLKGVRTALNFPHDERRIRFVCFLTDGYIGDEERVLRAVSDELGGARLFSFGVGSAPNRFLMNRLALMGRGAAAYLNPDDDGGAVMDAFLDRVRTPALADVEIEWNGLRVSDLSYELIPDLYAGRPVTLIGRYDPRAGMPSAITVSGRTHAGTMRLDVPFDADAGTHPALADLWARSLIARELNDAICGRGADPTQRIRRLALHHGLLSPYTAYVAVDSSRVTEGDFGVSTVQPVSVPDGVRYDTTVR